MPGTQAHPERGLTETGWREAERLWQLPFVMTADWWTGVIDAFHPARRCPAHPDAEHAQLEVPEPFESEGEHGLFA
jgi:hypothetical protein